MLDGGPAFHHETGKDGKAHSPASRQPGRLGADPSRVEAAIVIEVDDHPGQGTEMISCDA
jgi:hypothetical protein